MGKKIVSIGAGTGQSAIMQGLITIPGIEIVALVTTTDNGGSSAMIRESLDIPSPGDVRNVINAVNTGDDILSQLVNYRFSEGELTGMHLGNLIVGALSRICGSYEQGIMALNTLLHLPVRVLPISNHPAQICAELEDGTHIAGEWQIIKRQNREMTIVRYYLDGNHPAVEDGLTAVQKADLIIICPGVLGTGIISTLLFDGLKNAITQNSNAEIVYIANVMTYPSQTTHMTLYDHVSLLESYLGRKISTIIVNTTLPPRYIIDSYRQVGSFPLTMDIDRLHAYTVIQGDFLIDYGSQDLPDDLVRVAGHTHNVGHHRIRHSGKKIAPVINSLIHG